MGALHAPEAPPSQGQGAGHAGRSWHRRYPDLASGLRTGFCGSLTTFSGWMLAAFQAPWHDCLLQLASGTGVAVALLLCGRALSASLQQLHLPAFPATRAVLSAPGGATPAYVVAAAACAAAAFILPPPGGTHLLLAAVVASAPVGALARWRLSSINRSAAGPRRLPAGTLATNLLACAIGFGLISPAACPHLPPALSSVILIGVLGSLSTVSTWAEELVKMGQSGRLLKAASYWGLSIAGAAMLSCLAKL